MGGIADVPHAEAAALAAATPAKAISGVPLPSSLARAMSGELPVHDPPLEPRDEAVFLLHTAAEIEHALLVQYLYAAYSLRPKSDFGAADPHGDLVAGWRSTIVNIAKEEMGHLVTVQNLLLLLGAPLNFEREAMPFKSEFYPFHFRLEPLTKASLAKYVLAEMPDDPDHEVLSERELMELRRLARIGSDAAVVNRVGALYMRLLLLLSSLRDDDFLPAGSGFTAFQAPGDVWSLTIGQTLNILVPPVTDRLSAISAVIQIAAQGEASDDAPGEEPSHFRRFFEIYKAFPDAAPQSATDYWQPTRPVATNPNTLKDPHDDAAVGNITDDHTLDWARLFNLHYRLLLNYLAHYLSLSDPVPKGFLQGTSLPNHLSIFPLMIRLRRIADNLTQLPRANGGDPARDAAGPAFELPTTLVLPVREADRWRLHLYVHGLKDRLIDKLSADPADAQKLTNFKLSAEDRQFMTDRANMPEPPTNAGGGGSAAPGKAGG
jgi:hypothetical protein